VSANWRQQGKTRFLGLTAIGDTAALHRDSNDPFGLRKKLLSNIAQKRIGLKIIIK
jgi:hypothetical protein